MKGKHSFLKYSALFTAVFMFWICLISSYISANAKKIKQTIKPDAECSLTIDCEYDSKPIENAEFSLYLIADIDEEMNVTYTQEFIDSGIELDFENSSAEELSACAVTLETYIMLMERRKIFTEVVAEGLTDHNGLLNFDDLDAGIYLLTGETTVNNNEAYTPVASIITLPNNLDEDGEIDYNPVVFPKLEATQYPEPTQPETTKMTVEKIWKDEGYENIRPESVKVILFRDGEEYDEVSLNEENNWKYTWNNLSGNCRWQLIEDDVPEGYKMTSVPDGAVFTVTNVYEEPENPTNPEEPTEPETSETPSEPETPSESTTPENPYIPNYPNNPNTTTTTTTTKKGTPVNNSTPGSSDSSTTKTTIKKSSSSTTSKTSLPQTGQLEWPIPLLASGGLILLLTGSIMRRKRGD